MPDNDLILVSPLTLREQTRLNIFAESMFEGGQTELTEAVLVGWAIGVGRPATDAEKNHLRLKWFEMLEEATKPKDEK